MCSLKGVENERGAFKLFVNARLCCKAAHIIMPDTRGAPFLQWHVGMAAGLCVHHLDLCEIVHLYVQA